MKERGEEREAEARKEERREMRGMKIARLGREEER